MGDLNRYFSRAEFACKCGCGFDTVDALLLEALREVRVKFKKPVVITSACRCEEHNQSVGGSENSQHKKGRAADIVVVDTDPSLVADFVEDLGMSVGCYPNFTHVDSRTGVPVKWRG